MTQSIAEQFKLRTIPKDINQNKKRKYKKRVGINLPTQVPKHKTMTTDREIT
tara:strand:+ start:82 stop:237 length:156 start_codon:yes stop_codon:yes gene_type:complete